MCNPCEITQPCWPNLFPIFVCFPFSSWIYMPCFSFFFFSPPSPASFLYCWSLLLNCCCAVIQWLCIADGNLIHLLSQLNSANLCSTSKCNLKEKRRKQHYWDKEGFTGLEKKKDLKFFWGSYSFESGKETHICEIPLNEWGYLSLLKFFAGLRGSLLERMMWLIMLLLAELVITGWYLLSFFPIYIYTLLWICSVNTFI